MNTVTDAFVDQDAAADAPRLREIPYNYTSFSDREIVIRLLGAADVAAARRAARRAAHRPLGADAVRGAGRHLGRRAQSVPAGRPARQSEAAGAAGRRAAPSAARDREAPREPRGDGARTPSATRKVAQLSPRRSAAVDRFARSFAETAALRKRARRVLARHTRHGQHRVRRPRARVARDRRHRLARRVSVRRALSRTPRTRCAAWSRAASSSGSRSSRAAAAPATRAARFRSTRASAVINTEKLERLSAVERDRAAGPHASPSPTIDCRRRRGHAARDGRGRGARDSSSPSIRRRPTRRASAATSR